jgi:hypothetical protein
VPKLLLITALLCGCSVRHLEGHDRYFEVCVDGEIEFHLELGNEEIACDSSPARSGQLRIKMAPSGLSEMPTELGVEDLILVEWCSDESACLPATGGLLTLVAYEEGIALSGPYSFALADGSHIEGELAAQFCDYSPCP